MSKAFLPRESSFLTDDAVALRSVALQVTHLGLGSNEMKQAKKITSCGSEINYPKT
jgi:hypothetical protein